MPSSCSQGFAQGPDPQERGSAAQEPSRKSCQVEYSKQNGRPWAPVFFYIVASSPPHRSQYHSVG